MTMAKIIQSDGNGGYIVKKVTAHVVGWIVTGVLGVLVFYIINERANALSTIAVHAKEINALKQVLPAISNDVETILLNQKRLAEKAGIEYVEPPRPSNRYSIDDKE